MSWTATILTILPEIYPGPLQYSLAGRALENKLWQLEVINIRSFAKDKHGTVDDKPFGGGVGMVMLPEVLADALDHAKAGKLKPKLIYLSPKGALLTQQKIKSLASEQNIIMLAGRFEGIDQRIIEEYELEEVSIGDYILSGGDIAALAVIDACVRLLPGVTNSNACLQESFGLDDNYQYLLEYPLYTRPAQWRGKKVPDILLSGHHQLIEKWKLTEAENLTKERRKDLWQNYLDAKLSCQI